LALRIIGALVAAAAAVLVLLGLVTGLLVDWDWLQSLGYGGVFWTVLVAKVARRCVLSADPGILSKALRRLPS
jgi:uncharacterized membrane protein (UPF0182 family)